MKKIRILTEILVSCFLIAGCGQKSYFEQEKTYSSNDKKADSHAAADDDSQNEKTADVWYVQISGAVKNPGVYPVKAKSRVFYVIKKAGGLLEEADDQDINQAEPVTDGQKIYIKTKTERAEELKNEEKSTLVNINTADEKMLMTLPGIGESKARMIIAYREEHGSFSSIEDLKKIAGIKDGVFNKIKDSISAE